MKKANATGDVALVDVSQSSLGVRTRARTLALQRRLQSSAAASPPYSCFLELRSRRLEKPLLLEQYLQRKTSAPVLKQGVACGEEENPRPEKGRYGSGSNSIEENRCFERRSEGEFEIGDSEIEACVGENNSDLEARESFGRSTRESTPCNLIMAADNITPPGSTTKQRNPLANRKALRNIPTTREIEDFFTRAEHSQQHLFIQKYNFDVVNDVPVLGRYEWVQV